jgi:hypothetical protein
MPSKNIFDAVFAYAIGRPVGVDIDQKAIKM